MGTLGFRWVVSTAVPGTYLAIIKARLFLLFGRVSAARGWKKSGHFVFDERLFNPETGSSQTKDTARETRCDRTHLGTRYVVVEVDEYATVPPTSR